MVVKISKKMFRIVCAVLVSRVFFVSLQKSPIIRGYFMTPIISKERIADIQTNRQTIMMSYFSAQLLPEVKLANIGLSVYICFKLLEKTLSQSEE